MYTCRKPQNNLISSYGLNYEIINQFYGHYACCISLDFVLLLQDTAYSRLGMK